MPLPDGLPELLFAGVLGNRAFRCFRDDEGSCVSADADFAIPGCTPCTPWTPRACTRCSWRSAAGAR